MRQRRFAPPTAKTFILLTLLLGASAQANSTLLLAENGSERTLEQIRKQQDRTALKLAEGGSDRLLEHIRALDEEREEPFVSDGDEGTSTAVNT